MRSKVWAATAKPVLGQAFVVSQIGDPDSAVRRRADDVIAYIIQPALRKWRLKALRSDQDPTPGQVTSRIITSLLRAKVVIADLTGQNPNVYYELAVAHSFGRPVVILVDHTDKLTFDAQHERVIEIGDDGTIGAKQAVKASWELRKTLEVVLASSYVPSNLVIDVATARRLDELAAHDPFAAELSNIRGALEEIKGRLSQSRFISSGSTIIDTSALNPMIRDYTSARGVLSAGTSAVRLPLVSIPTLEEQLGSQPPSPRAEVPKSTGRRRKRTS